MRSFLSKPDSRHKAFLSLASQVEGQLRAAYERRFDEGSENQVTLGRKLGVTRSAVNKRLNGRINMTMETISDMAWALGHRIAIRIYDPQETTSNQLSIEGGDFLGTVSPSTEVVTPRFDLGDTRSAA